MFVYRGIFQWIAISQLSLWRCRHITLSRWRVAGLLVTGLMLSGQLLAASLSADAFGTLENIEQVRLSPDGKRIAALVNLEGEYTLETRSLTDDNVVHHIQIEDSKFNHFEWVNDERLLLSVRAPTRQASNSLELTFYSQHWDGSVRTDLTASHKRKINMIRRSQLRLKSRSTLGHHQPTYISQFQHRIVSFLPDDEQHILLAMEDVAPGSLDVFRVNLYTGKAVAVQRSRSQVYRWLADKDGIVRAGFGYKDKDRSISTIIYREHEKAPWRTIMQYDNRTQGAAFEPVGFTDDPRILIVLKVEQGIRAYYYYDLQQQKTLKQLAPFVNASAQQLTFTKTGKPLAVQFYDEYYRSAFVDPSLASLHQKLEGQYPGEIVSMESWNDQQSLFVVKITSPTRPGDFYLYKANKSALTFFAHQYPGLDSKSLVPMNSLTFTARDGLKIPAYVTVPIDDESGLSVTTKNVKFPTVVLVHGGPRSRDVWGFNPLVQFLASRGYAVLQVNFRGSDGFTEDYYLRGYQQWGTGMLHDVIDGTRWLIQHGITDPKRVCVMGGSYGGYAALQTLVIEPELFQCSMAWAPVADMADYMSRQQFTHLFKNLSFYVSASDDYSSISPYANAGKINVPVLVVHGEQDNRVPVQLSRNFYRRMKRLNKSIEYIEYPDGDHFFSRQHNRQDFLKRAEIFLARYLH